VRSGNIGIDNQVTSGLASANQQEAQAARSARRSGGDYRDVALTNAFLELEERPSASCLFKRF